MIYLKDLKDDARYKRHMATKKAIKKFQQPKPEKKYHIRYKIKKNTPKPKLRRLDIVPSKGEKMVIDFLNEQGLHFLREYNACFYEGKRQFFLYYDFYVPEYRLLIEFDGLHHYKPTYGQEQFEKTKKHDAMKDKWAKKNKFHLLRIPCFVSDKIGDLIAAKCDKIKPIK